MIYYLFILLFLLKTPNQIIALAPYSKIPKENLLQSKSVKIPLTQNDVRSHIEFGTAGYRALHRKQSLQKMLNQQTNDNKVSEKELQELQKYIEKTKESPQEEGVNEHVIRLLAKSLVHIIKNYNQKNELKVKQVILDYDVRIDGKEYSKLFTQALSILIKENVIEEVISLEYVSTPELSLLMRKRYPQALGIHLTSSHNPFYFFGIKLETFEGKGATEDWTNGFEEEYHQQYQQALQEGFYFFHQEDLSIQLKRESFFKEYLQYIKENCQLFFPDFSFDKLQEKLSQQKLRIGIDANWGEAIYFWEQFHHALPFDYQPLFQLKNFQLGGIPQGSFKFQLPEPSIHNLKGRFQNSNIQYIIANDPDADRVSILEFDGEQYQEVSANILSFLFVGVLCQKIKKGEIKNCTIIIATTMASSTLALKLIQHFKEDCDKFNVKVRCINSLPVGFKYFANTPQTKQTQKGENLLDSSQTNKFAIVYEESGGISTQLYEKDGLFSGILALNFIAENGSLLEQERYFRSLLPTKIWGNSKSFAFKEWLENSSLNLEKLKSLAEYKPNNISLLIKVWQSFCEKNEFLIKEEQDIKGLKITLQHKSLPIEGWLVFRVSGTEPKVRWYNELETKESSLENHIKSQVQEMLEKAVDPFKEFLKQYLQPEEKPHSQQSLHKPMPSSLQNLPSLSA